MSRISETAPGHNTSVGKDSRKCPICNRAFVMRKTMLRHLRTIHGSKHLGCQLCGRKFLRQDNLNRHMAEQHTSNDHLVTCELCHRRMFKRSLPEHLESRTCRASQTKTGARLSEHPYVEDENDCFHLTIRVLKIWLSLRFRKEDQSSERHSSSCGSFSQHFPSSDAFYQCCYLGSRALDLTKFQMEDSVAPQNSLKLFCTAVLWASISLVGVHSVEDVPIGFRDWDAHLKGAAALLEVFHSSTCDCDKYLSCRQLQRRASQDPALSLFKAIVRDTGLAGVLLRVLPSIVQQWENAIRMLDVLIQCVLNQFDHCGKDFAGCQTLCEAKGIEVDLQRNRGLEAMIWAVFKDTGG